MIAFPSAFTDALTASFGADTAARVLTALGSEAPSVSVRFNPFRLPLSWTFWISSSSEALSIFLIFR